MIENKKVITWSLIFLFLCLSIVYSLTYQKKESLFKATIKSWNEITNQTWAQNQNIWFTTLDTTNTKSTQNIETTNSVSLWDTKGNWTNVWAQAEPEISTNLGSPNVKILPGTTEYFGTLDIISILWETPEYTLQDSKGNYFAYYWDHLEFKDTIETLWWNVYEMVTEAEILQNQLFGEKVSYINMSVFKDIWVIMVIKIDGEIRLLQIPADKYHYSKDYLKSLFIH